MTQSKKNQILLKNKHLTLMNSLKKWVEMENLKRHLNFNFLVVEKIKNLILL